MNIVTHDGSFHQDELFAIGLLEKFLLCDHANITRTRSDDLIKKAQASSDTFVIDVGRIYNPEKICFDHHQKDFDMSWEVTQNDGSIIDVPYSSTGLIFKYLLDNGHLSDMDDDSIDYIRDNYIINIDANDNGVFSFDKLNILDDFNRQFIEKEDRDLAFENAMIMTRMILDNIIYKAIEHSHIIRDTQNSIKNIIVIEEDDKTFKAIHVPMGSSYCIDYLMTHVPDIDFIITQRRPYEFGIKTAPLSLDDEFSQKNTIPEYIINDFNSGGDLSYLAEGGEVIFVHKNGFFSVIGGNLDEAVAFAKNIKFD